MISILKMKTTKIIENNFNNKMEGQFVILKKTNLKH